MLIDVLAAVDFNNIPTTEIPGMGNATTLLGWAKWGGYVVAFVGLVMIAGGWLIASRSGHGDGGDLGKLGKWGFGVLLLGAAGPIVVALS
jgi:hypothetical protein